MCIPFIMRLIIINSWPSIVGLYKWSYENRGRYVYKYVDKCTQYWIFSLILISVIFIVNLFFYLFVYTIIILWSHSFIIVLTAMFYVLRIFWPWIVSSQSVTLSKAHLRIHPSIGFSFFFYPLVFSPFGRYFITVQRLCFLYFCFACLKHWKLCSFQ